MHCLLLYLYAHDHLSSTCRQVYDPLYNNDELHHRNGTIYEKEP